MVGRFTHEMDFFSTVGIRVVLYGTRVLLSDRLEPPRVFTSSSERRTGFLSRFVALFIFDLRCCVRIEEIFRLCVCEVSRTCSYLYLRSVGKLIALMVCVGTLKTEFIIDF